MSPREQEQACECCVSTHFGRKENGLVLGEVCGKGRGPGLKGADDECAGELSGPCLWGRVFGLRRHGYMHRGRERRHTADQFAEGAAGITGRDRGVRFSILCGRQHTTRSQGVHARRAGFSRTLRVERPLCCADSGDKSPARGHQVQDHQQPRGHPERARATLETCGCSGPILRHQSSLAKCCTTGRICAEFYTPPAGIAKVALQRAPGDLPFPCGRSVIADGLHRIAQGFFQCAPLRHYRRIR